MEQILALFIAHKWMALAIVTIGYLTRLSKDDSRFPVTIPSRWRPVVPLVLGQVYAALVASQGGMPWKQAVMVGLTTSVWTLGLYALVIGALFNGNEPQWLKTLALVLPRSPSSTDLAKADPSSAIDVEKAPIEKVDAPPKTK